MRSRVYMRLLHPRSVSPSVMGYLSLSSGCGCPLKHPQPSPPDVPPLPQGPVDLFKDCCKLIQNTIANCAETDAWVICAPDCETITVAKKIRLALGSNQNIITQLSTDVIDCYRMLCIRPEEWRRHPELGECPRRGWYIYVECTRETIELGIGNGLPTFDTDSYTCFWDVNGRSVKPCFNFTPPV
jgi:hypothetical protein